MDHGGLLVRADHHEQPSGICAVATGLRRIGQVRGGATHVIGDSQLVLRQLRNRHINPNSTLREWYDSAASFTAHVHVRGWHHHFHSHNKMADTAANRAMDGGRSSTWMDGDPHTQLYNEVTGTWIQT